MQSVGRLQHLLAHTDHRWCLPMVDRGRREQPNPAVAMLLVIPLDERAHPRAGVNQAPELLREARSVFQLFELGFRIRIVVLKLRA